MFACNSRGIDGLLPKYSLLTTRKYLYYDLKEIKESLWQRKAHYQGVKEKDSQDRAQTGDNFTSGRVLFNRN